MKVTEQFSRQALEPFIKYCAKRPGMIGEVVKQMTDLTGQQQYRQNVNEWLHTDEKQRVEPRLGIGVALLIVAARFVNSVKFNATGVAIMNGMGQWQTLRLPDTKPRRRAKNKTKAKVLKRVFGSKSTAKKKRKTQRK